ncbi:MAG TPA: nuclear transport factor 2 family protein [Reyranella sp.]|nr:nuclear transport factor 2 family protein [Reyranella sp.]
MIGRRSLAGAALLAFADVDLVETAACAQDQADTAKLREELMALERQSWDYMKTRDRGALRRFLADDLLQVYADGSRYYKNDFLDYIANYRLDSYDIEPTYAVRRIGPDVAVLIYRVTSRGTPRFDRARTDKVIASSTYVRRNGKWTSVLYQETPIK